MKRAIITVIFCISWELNAQVALPTFQGVQAAAEVSLYSFSSHTFTNSSATGNTGPTLANCKSSYDVTWENDTDLFNVQTQGIQEWTVPASGTYRITALGASGGAFSGTYSRMGYPGAGATVVGDISLTIGTVLKIVVGQKPTSTISNGGNNGSAGGGASWVYTGSIGSNGLIIVAGGGGGTGHGNASGVAGNGKGGKDANTSNESSNGENFGENQRRGSGSVGNIGTGYGGKKSSGGSHNGGGGGAGWLGDGQDYTNYGRGGDRFVGGISEDGTHLYGGFGGGGGSGGNGNAGGGGGGYTGGGAGYGYISVTGGGTSWGGGGGGGSYASSSMSSVTMTEGDSGIDYDDVANGSVIIAKQ